MSDLLIYIGVGIIVITILSSLFNKPRTIKTVKDIIPYHVRDIPCGGVGYVSVILGFRLGDKNDFLIKLDAKATDSDFIVYNIDGEYIAYCTNSDLSFLQSEGHAFVNEETKPVDVRSINWIQFAGRFVLSYFNYIFFSRRIAKKNSIIRDIIE